VYAGLVSDNRQEETIMEYEYDPDIENKAQREDALIHGDALRATITVNPNPKGYERRYTVVAGSGRYPFDRLESAVKYANELTVR